MGFWGESVDFGMVELSFGWVCVKRRGVTRKLGVEMSRPCREGGYVSVYYVDTLSKADRRLVILHMLRGGHIGQVKEDKKPKEAS